MSLKQIEIREETLPRAWHSALVAMQNASIYPCPDYNTECREVSMNIVITDPLKEPRLSKYMPCGFKELRQYEREVLDGILDFCIDPSESTTYWPYTYHDRMTNHEYFSPISILNREEPNVLKVFRYAVNQVKFCLGELRRNPNSRRAVIDIRRIDDVSSSDAACMQNIQFLLRDGKLDMYVLFRSNDIYSAAFMNMWALIKFQENMAFQLGVPVGYYVHKANSMHIYKKCFEPWESTVRSILNQKPARMENDHYFFYGSEYENGMEPLINAYDEEIDQLIKQLWFSVNFEE